MKAIFLDFDGVITTQRTRYELDKRKLNILGRILEKTDAKIVISSSWRRYTLEATLEKLNDASGCFMNNMIFPFCDKVVGVTDRLYAFCVGSNEKHYRICRGNEIDKYLSEHEEITSYVILDDDSDMLLKQKSYFVKTDTYRGLSNRDADKAIKILNK